jgi:hypothetical protein
MATTMTYFFYDILLTIAAVIYLPFYAVRAGSMAAS